MKKKGFLFSETILKIFHNLIPHEKINCDDRNFPWIPSSVKINEILDSSVVEQTLV